MTPDETGGEIVVAESDASEKEPGTSLPELGERLGIGPNLFRGYLESFSDLLPVREEDGQRVLDATGVSLLERIHRLSREGFTPKEIRGELGAESQDCVVSGSTGNEDVDLPDVALALAEIFEMLERLEKRRLEDRDKLMLTLIKTQKEIQQLRYEMAAREGRRRKGLFARLFGR